MTHALIALALAALAWDDKLMLDWLWPVVVAAFTIALIDDFQSVGTPPKRGFEITIEPD